MEDVLETILASVDLDQQLNGVVWSGGRLDILAALDLRQDRIRTRDGRLLRGRVTDEKIEFEAVTPGAQDKKKDLKVGEILKLVPVANDADGNLRMRIAMNKSGKLVYEEVVTTTSSLTIRNDTSTETVPMLEIADFVGRHFR